MTASDLPPLVRFATEVLGIFGGGESAFVEEGDYPAIAIAPPQAGHLILVRDHGGSFTLSLPTDESWSFRSRAEWTEIAPRLKAALASYRTRHPQAVAMADAMLRLTPMLKRLTGRRWLGSFPGTPIPQEAWLKESVGSVGFFQEEASVRIVVWVGSAYRAKTVTSVSDLAPIAPWLETEVQAQLVAAKEEANEEERKRTLPLPAIADVLAALRAGKRIIVYAGRSGKTYFMESGALHRDLYEEAEGWVEDATEASLQEDIERYPDVFRGLKGDG